MTGKTTVEASHSLLATWRLDRSRSPMAMLPRNR